MNYEYIVKEYDKELKKRMSEEEYHKFSVRLAKEAFHQTIENMADGDFKDFVLENFEKITK